MSDEKVEKAEVKAWGLRLQVPAAILRELGLSVGDKVVWEVEKRNGEKVAILKGVKKE